MINHLVSAHDFELRDSGNPKVESLPASAAGMDHRFLFVFHLQKRLDHE